MSAKLLVAAGEAAANAKELPFGVRELIDASEEILVITPTLPWAVRMALVSHRSGPRTG